MKTNKKLFGVLLLHLGLMVLAFSSLLFMFFEWVLPAITKHGQAITVPNLKGMHIDTLPDFFKQRSLRFKVTDDVAYAPDYPPAVVLDQYPKPGDRVKEGRSIYITLNANQAPDVCMPNLVDGSVRNAQVILKSKGLVVGKIKYVPDIAQNAVLAQHHAGQPIEPGTRIAQGSYIDLTVGAGLNKQLLTVPDLVGMKIADAELFLLDLGIRVDKIKYMHESESIGEIIAKQYPSAGVEVKFGQTVDVWLDNDPSNDASTETESPILPPAE